MVDPRTFFGLGDPRPVREGFFYSSGPLLDAHGVVLIDSVGNFAARSHGTGRGLAAVLRALADAIDGEGVDGDE